MTPDPTVPAAAVQIAAEALASRGYGPDLPSDFYAVLDALAAAEWLHDPKRVAELEAEPRVCGAADGQYRCNIHRGHEGRHTAAINGHVLHAWDG